jgi:hypothetical protein
MMAVNYSTVCVDGTPCANRKIEMHYIWVRKYEGEIAFVVPCCR